MGHLWDNSHYSSHSFHWVSCHPNVQCTWIWRGIRLVMKFKRTLYTSFQLNIYWWLTNLLPPSEFQITKVTCLEKKSWGPSSLSFEMLVDCRCPPDCHYEHSLFTIMWIAYLSCHLYFKSQTLIRIFSDWKPSTNQIEPFSWKDYLKSNWFVIVLEMIMYFEVNPQGAKENKRKYKKDNNVFTISMHGHKGGVDLMTIFIIGPWVSVSAKWFVAFYVWNYTQYSILHMLTLTMRTWELVHFDAHIKT